MRQAIIKATEDWENEDGLSANEKLQRKAANRRGRKAVERRERGETTGICINEPCVMFTLPSNGGNPIPIRGAVTLRVRDSGSERG